MSGVGIMSLRVPDAPWRETLDAAVLAEALGYSSLTVGESWGGDAFTTIAQFAAVTSRIGVGTSIVPVFARTPANIAMTALNLDRMSEGRFSLGLGTSGQAVVEDLHGERFAKPIARMREYIDIIRKATRGERLDHEGEFFHTQRFTLQIRPFRVGLPIYIASLGPESLRMTGELADGWLPIFLAPSRMATAVAEIKASAEAAGRSLQASKSRHRSRHTSPATLPERATVSGRTSPFTLAAWESSTIATGDESASLLRPTGFARRTYRATATAQPGWLRTRWSTRSPSSAHRTSAASRCNPSLKPVSTRSVSS